MAVFFVRTKGSLQFPQNVRFLTTWTTFKVVKLRLRSCCTVGSMSRWAWRVTGVGQTCLCTEFSWDNLWILLVESPVSWDGDIEPCTRENVVKMWTGLAWHWILSLTCCGNRCSVSCWHGVREVSVCCYVMWLFWVTLTIVTRWPKCVGGKRMEIT